MIFATGVRSNRSVSASSSLTPLRYFKIGAGSREPGVGSLEPRGDNSSGDERRAGSDAERPRCRARCTRTVSRVQLRDGIVRLAASSPLSPLVYEAPGSRLQALTLHAPTPNS